MKKIVTLLFFLSLFFSNICFSQSGWYWQPTGTTNNIRSIDFLNENTGLAVGDSKLILRTTDGGENWAIINTSLPSMSIQDVQFLNDSEVYATGYSNILKSNNSGLDWFVQYSAPSGYFVDVFFTSTDTGVIVGRNPGSILITTNNGFNWNRTTFGTDEYHNVYISGNNIYVCGTAVYPPYYTAGFLRKSSDLGSNWIQIFGSGMSSSLHNVSFPIEGFGYIIWSTGGPDVLFKSSNSGINWSSCGNLGEVANSLYFIDSCSGYIVAGLDSIFKTTNCGQTFQVQRGGKNSAYWAVNFVNKLTGWVAGTDGIILKTTNGGEPVGINPINSEIPLSFFLSQNYPNPFNPVTKIKYDIPSNVKSEKSKVKLIVYDILGREIETLVYQIQKPGSYEVTWDASRYASGVYFYRLITDEYVETKKMVLIK